MRFFIILLFLSISDFCLAQKDAKLDSLLLVLQNGKFDTAIVNTLNAVSIQLWKISAKYDDARKYADSALMLSTKLFYKRGIANSYSNLGVIGIYKGNFVDAQKNVLSAKKIFEELDDKKGIAGTYHDLGSIYGYQGNYPEALKNHFACLKMKEELGDKSGVAASTSNIGITYYNQGNYQEALKKHLVALKMREEIGNKHGIAASFNNIGNVYFEQGNYPETMKNYLASLKIKEEIGDKLGIAYTNVNLGNISLFQNNYPEALKYYNASSKIYEEIGHKKGIADAYHRIGVVYGEQRNSEEALKYYLQCLKIREEIGDKAGMASSYGTIGSIYSNQANYSEALKYHLSCLKINEEIGDKKEIALSCINLGELQIAMGNFIESKAYLDKALSLSKEIGNKDLIKKSYDILSKLNNQTGNYVQALEYYKLHEAYKDSLLNESNGKSIAEMKTKYETEKKDKEIQQLESEKQINNLQLMIQHESLNRIQIEKAKIQTQNLFNLQQVELLGNEQILQQLEIDKNQAELIAQKSESEKKQNQLALLAKEGEIQKLEIRKQTLLRNYLIGGLVLLGLLSFFVYNNYSTRQKLKLQTLRNKIASDLHDDVGSTLSSISIFSQMAQEQSKEVIPLLDTIGESSRKMLDAMADIVWTINPENDQFEKIILRMRSFAYELLGAKGIDFEFSADEDIAKIKLPMEVRKNLYLIFKEATNNMVKYAGATKATFAIRGEKDHLSMEIRDNGKGFNPDKLSEGNGLKNMKKRAEEIGAKLFIKSFPGNGTSIQLVVAV
jgi:two-component system sensor histidine kinase UhpB